MFNDQKDVSCYAKMSDRKHKNKIKGRICVGNKFVMAAAVFSRLQALFQENPLDLQLNGFCGLLMGLKY